MSGAPGPHEHADEARAPDGRGSRGSRRPGRGSPGRRRLRALGRRVSAGARAALGVVGRVARAARAGLRRLPPGVRRRVPLASTALLTAALLACYSQVAQPSRPPSAAPSGLARFQGREPRVRVALVEAAPVLTFTLAGAWVATPDQGERVALGPGQVTVTLIDGAPSLSSADGVAATWPRATQVLLEPSGGETPPQTFEVGSRRFRGDVRVLRLAQRVKGRDGVERDAVALRLVTGVGLEDYLSGVIGHEMPLRWSDAALHAQAIAARTYALASLRPGQDHDLKSDERSQVYRGIMAEDARARAMVQATHGMVLTWQGDIFTTYFHSTCGGDTVPAHWIFGPRDDIPPLQGAAGCKCQASRLYRWSLDLPLPEPDLHSLVLELPLREVTFDAWPRGGYLETVTFVDAGGDRITRTAAELRAMLRGRLKSTSFEVTLAAGGRALTFSGRGWGHGVGLCQYGAEGFAKEGRTAEEILAHYYPGSRLERLGY